jgi:hypothetical protein
MIGMFGCFKCSNCGKESGKCFKWSEDSVSFGQCEECNGDLLRLYVDKFGKASIQTNPIPVQASEKSKQAKELADRKKHNAEWKKVNMPKIRAERGLI